MFDGNTNKVFTSIEEEYNSLKYGVGIRAVSDYVIIRFTGKETLEFLHRVSTNDVKNLLPFHKKNTLFLNEKGRFIDRATLINLDNVYFLIGSQDKSNKLLSWINKYIIMEDIQTVDISEEFVTIELYGSQMASYLTMLIGEDAQKISNDNIVFTHADGFSFHIFKLVEFNGISVHKILIDRSKASEFIDYMLTNKSVFDVNLIGRDSFELFRVEFGIPAYPNEINDSTNPHEANLINEVSFTKGCYIGQEVIARLDTYDKVQKYLTGFIFEEKISENDSLELVDDNKNIIGQITTSANSLTMQKQIAIGFIRKKSVNENSDIFVVKDNVQTKVSVSQFPIKK